MPSIAIVTNALDPGFYFPLWYRYYSRQIDASGMFVVTQGTPASAFADYRLGGVFAMPPAAFDEQRRAAAISTFVASLLQYFDIVVHTDTDEMLVADPRMYPSLGEYLAKLKLPYVTARGIDIFQREGEAEIDFGQNILIKQRKYGYLTSSMCKTAVTTMPITWSQGFHYCSVYPAFDALYMVHLKRLDLNQQLTWFDHMSGRSFADPRVQQYYAPDRQKLANFHQAWSRKPVIHGFDALNRTEFRERFLEKVCFDKRDGVYRGQHFGDDMVCKLPREFEGVF